MKNLFVITVSLLLAGSWARVGASASLQEASIKVEVRDAISGLPVPSALVTVIERQIERAPDGLPRLLPLRASDEHSFLSSTADRGLLFRNVPVTTTQMFAVRVAAEGYLDRTDYMVEANAGDTRE